MGYSFPCMYGTKNHQQLVGENIVSYFNELGEKLIAARESGIKLKPNSYDNPLYALTMRQVGITLNLLDAGFTGGLEHQICKTLLGTDNERYEYYWYFDNIYKTLCEEVEEGWEYTTYEDIIMNRIAAIKL